MTHPTFAFVAAATDEAQAACAQLQARYSGTDPKRAEVIVALGGDGFMLETLHATLDRNVAIFGMNCGTVGFLMNRFDEYGLADRVLLDTAVHAQYFAESWEFRRANSKWYMSAVTKHCSPFHDKTA